MVEPSNPGVLFQEEDMPKAPGAPAQEAVDEASTPTEQEAQETSPAAGIKLPLLSQLAEKDAHIAALREQIARTQADFENYRRRQGENHERDRLIAREGIIKNLLDPLDNLERALAALETTQDVASLASGLNLVLRQLKDVLVKEGLEVVESDGQTLNPSVHQAIAVEERNDVADQTIVETFQKGYSLGGRLLRPSMVKVARSDA